MDDRQKQEYRERYQQAKQHGVPFFPDVVFKDAVVSLIILVVLFALATFAGTPLEARADPADSGYTPRPEWYFLFLFQLLKYFPGDLEVLGVFVLPTLFLVALLALPFLDRTRRRHPFDRPWVTGATSLVVIGILFLTVQALLEAAPPAEAELGDPVAALYVQNCAGCHGPSIEVQAGVNIHEVIAQGQHSQGMPAWSADLDTDEIDALAGFISSPSGSRLFNTNCGACHQAPDLVATSPALLKTALDQAAAFEPHAEVAVPDWTNTLSAQQRTDLLNFLVAPDGQRLYTVNCTSCHGQAVAFEGERAELRQIIEEGGLHLEMPGWRGRLEPEQVETLAAFVVDPLANPEAEDLFRQHCTSCHGALVPLASDLASAQQTILEGGPHETMPVWGQTLTPAQLDALVSHTYDAARGAPVEQGRTLFAQHCSACHGDFGEGGANPTRAGDVIAPISSSEYLSTRDDFTLRAIIEQGQPNFGMSPFGSSQGGPLDTDQIEAIVTFFRSWEENPPVELPPEVRTASLSLGGAEIFADLCAQCHGPQGQGGLGPALADPAFQAENDDASIFTSINQGHPATPMIGWGEVLTSDQISQLVDYIRQLDSSAVNTAGEVSFGDDIQPLLTQACGACHGSLGGWEASSYQTVMESGDHAPVIVPGDPAASLLFQLINGTAPGGDLMPPGGKLPEAQIQLLSAWIEAGALDN
ncbi:MAG TPA: c-type cytochrome [Anaerolineales bacterium]|jgi:mono/diheme cytochrome c family protein